MAQEIWLETTAKDMSAPPTILVAEDDEALAIVIQGKLSRTGYRVHVERDGKTAWSAIRDQLPDLVVLDWMMPEMDGLTVLTLIRDNPTTKHIPVIMLTAMAQPSDVKSAITSGANDYIVKPFKPEDLANRTSKLLKNRALR